ncbi:unnamed protein product [Closterium sp. NIES-53]
MNRRNVRLPPEVNRAIYVRNLPFNITSEEMYDIFGKYGAIRQIRIGVTKETRGTAFVVYEDIYDAKNAVEHLSGFNVANRYLIVLYYQQAKFTKKIDQQSKFTKKIDQVCFTCFVHHFQPGVQFTVVIGVCFLVWRFNVANRYLIVLGTSRPIHQENWPGKVCSAALQSQVQPTVQNNRSE